VSERVGKKMKYIKSLTEMEQIVQNSKQLFWDGWTVVHRYRSDKAKTSKYGVYFKGNWYMERRFEPSRDGWDIPERLVIGHAQT
jgi:hypothetical protein